MAYSYCHQFSCHLKYIQNFRDSHDLCLSLFIRLVSRKSLSLFCWFFLWFDFINVKLMTMRVQLSSVRNDTEAIVLQFYYFLYYIHQSHTYDVVFKSWTRSNSIVFIIGWSMVSPLFSVKFMISCFFPKSNRTYVFLHRTGTTHGP